MAESIEDIIRKYFRLVNEEKFEQLFEEVFDPDVEFHAPFNFNTKGIENVKPFYLSVPVNYPEHVDTPEKIIVSENGKDAAVFIDFVGKTKEGIEVAFKAVDWFVFENGKIKKQNVFFDSQTLLKIIAGEQ